MRIWIVILFLAVVLSLLACSREAEEAPPVTGSSVQDLKETACSAADKAGTCTTRLPELGFVTKEECCELYKRCC